MQTRAARCASCGAQEAQPISRARDYIYAGTDVYLSHVRCSACGHIYLNPQPTQSSLPEMYPANYGTFSNKFRGKRNLLAKLKTTINLRRLRSLAGEIGQEAHILDVGCGNGELLLALRAESPDLRLTGIDWHFPTEVRAALEQADIELIEAPLEAVELPSGRFDIILMLQLIEHLWDPEGGVKRLTQALAPSGRLVIETPNTNGYDRGLFHSGAWGGYYVPRHLNLYDFNDLAGLTRRAGLDVLAQRNLPAPVVWCYSLQGWLRERFGQTVWIAKLFEPRNLPVLAMFAALDSIAIKLGKATSNQQLIAVRSATAE